MKIKYKWLIVAAAAIFSAAAVYAVMQIQGSSGIVDSDAKPGTQASVSRTPGRVTMIDLGADGCVPCKMMAPILVELEKEYAGRADIIFIDVWKEPDQARKFGIRSIPTQIFFDKNGKEVYRHTGFMDKKRIVDILAGLGVT
jgi:thioredoxin 1